MITVAVVISVCVALDPVSVQRWSSDQPVVGEMVSVGLQGIELRQEGVVLPEMIPWYDLRSIEPPRSEAVAYQQQAGAAWRASARRARGDLAGALPIYESLREPYLWQLGAQSQDVSMGLALCLSDAERRSEAVLPMLSWFVAAQAHTPGIGTTEPLIDEQTLLLLALPPVFTQEQQRLGLEGLPESSLLTDRERLLHAYYAMAIGQGSASESRVEEIEELKRSMRSRDAGTILVEQMVFAQTHPDPSKRQASRDALSRRTRTQRESWIEVWARLGLGAALLGDSDPNEQERGVIELLHVVTRLSRIDPGLTMLAAELASTHLAATGRAAWGHQILRDARAHLTNRYAAAPALAQETQPDD